MRLLLLSLPLLLWCCMAFTAFAMDPVIAESQSVFTRITLVKKTVCITLANSGPRYQMQLNNEALGPMHPDQQICLDEDDKLILTSASAEYKINLAYENSQSGIAVRFISKPRYSAGLQREYFIGAEDSSP